MTSQSWQGFFDEFAPQYENECFTKDTLREVEFLVELLALPSGAKILDVGCGTCRHSVELARRGYRMTGVDISAGMLAQARQNAAKAGVEIELVQANAANCRPGGTFEAAICLCEGAFCLLGEGDDPIGRDLAMLKNISAALADGGRFVLTTLNGYRKARSFSNADVAAGKFDPLALVEPCTLEYQTPAGKRTFTGQERGYMPTELTLLCRLAGLQAEHIWGGTAGNWGRRPLDLDEIEVMVVAQKAGIGAIG